MKLNEYQKKAIWVGAVIILLMGLFPPWTYTFKSASVYSEKPTGYAFLFWPPPPEKSSYLHGVRLDFNRLFLQWFMVAGACVGLLLWLKTTTEDRSTKPQHLMTEEELSRIAKEYLKKLVKLGFQIKI
ncbi:hypothetical protein KA005_32230, partial [bacterium]|nr:hypothetical protein [bacterium]